MVVVEGWNVLHHVKGARKEEMSVRGNVRGNMSEGEMSGSRISEEVFINWIIVIIITIFMP